MKMKRTLLDDVEKIYYSIPCNLEYGCKDCINFELCKLLYYLVKSLKKYY